MTENNTRPNPLSDAPGTAQTRRHNSAPTSTAHSDRVKPSRDSPGSVATRRREVTVAVPQLVAMSAVQRSAAIDAVRALLLPAVRGHQTRGKRAA
jgi:hypothetical protein